MVEENDMFLMGFGLGVLAGWVAFEKPEMARNALDWAKGKLGAGK